MLAVAVASCSSAAPPSTSSAPSTPSTTTTVPMPTTTLPVSAQSFSIDVGADGITYDPEGSPPSGPSSFAVSPDGTVVVADTIAARRGEARLVSRDVDGVEEVIPLAQLGVESVVDVVALGDLLVLLDVDVARDRYRVVSLADGALAGEVEVPVGSRFADGLTGLALDDGGWLLEFELGAWYERLDASGVVRQDSLTLDGVPVAVEAAETGEVVRLGDRRIEVDRETEIGSTFVVGLPADGTLVVMVDEVTVGDAGIVVDRSVRRYGTDGSLIGSIDMDLAAEAVHIARPIELAPNGAVVYLFAEEDRVVLEILDV